MASMEAPSSGNFLHWFTESSDLQRPAREHEAPLAELYAPMGKLTTQREWLKKNLAFTLSRTERLGFLEPPSERVPMSL